jgi:hypothetical protein
MGYNTTASTLTLTAKLTPIGRQKLVSTNNALITSFSFGDSDANYYASNPLLTGQVPAEAGLIGANASMSNSTAQIANLKSVLIVNGNGVLRKPVQQESLRIISEVVSNGQIIVSGTSISQDIINRNDFAINSLVNLYYSFGLSLNSSQDSVYTGKTFSNGGYSDTALSGLATTNIIAFGINNSMYGECIDGKQIMMSLPTTAGTYTIYSTFQNKGASLKTEDANIRDTSAIISGIDSNIAFLFSDQIMKPNGGAASLSWGTGFGTVKPFSLNKKSLYNLQTTANLGLSADTIVGIAYLDKGFIVITHPIIIGHYNTATASATTITLNSVSTAVYQSITCIAARGEFGASTNPTFGAQDVPRISEVGLYDKDSNLIAIAKTDRHIYKNVNDFIALGIKIML